SVRGPALSLSPSAPLPNMPSAPPAPLPAVEPPPPAPEPAPAPAKARSHDWRGWAIIGAAAVLLIAGAVFGLHWAISARGPAAALPPNSGEGTSLPPAES